MKDEGKNAQKNFFHGKRGELVLPAAGRKIMQPFQSFPTFGSGGEWRAAGLPV